MPTYEFECKCGFKTEIYLHMTNNLKAKCPKCQKKMRRLISGGLPPVIEGTTTPYKGK